MLRSPTTDPPPPRARRAALPRSMPWEALAMTLVAFALRAAVAWMMRGGHSAAASTALDAIAWNLARGLGFTLPGAAAGVPTSLVAPAAPFLTSLLYRLTGHDVFAATLLQCGLGALVPVALAGFARATWGSGVARIAGWLAVVSPLPIAVFLGDVGPQSTFALALLLALSATAEWVKTPRPGRALGTGILWGLAALAGPVALYLPLVVVAWAWFPLGLTLAAGDRVRQLAMLLLGVALAVGPWTIRNARELHAFVPITTGAGISPEGAALEAGGGNLAEARPALARLGSYWRPRFGGPAFAGIRANEFLPAWADPLLAWSVLVLPLALFGAWTLLASPKRIFLSLPLLTIAAFTTIAVIAADGVVARVPIESLVALHAAVGADALWKRLRFRRRGLALVGPRR